MRKPGASFASLIVAAVLSACQGQSTVEGQPPPTNAYLEILHRAEAKSREGQWPEATGLWARVVQMNPVRGDSWQQLATARYGAGEYREAIPAYEKVLALGLDRGYASETAYDVARCYAALGEKEQALRWLTKAFDMGYRYLQKARSDTDFQSLHADPRFQELTALADTSGMTRDEGWRYDLRLLAREVKRRGYAPFHKVSEADFDAAVEELYDSIPRLSDVQISIGMMKLMAMVGDGHTMLYGFYERPELLQNVPVDFYWFEEGLFIVAADVRYQDLLGARVLRFGDHSVEEVLQALDPLISRDNDMATKVMGPMRMRNLPLLHGLGLLPDPEKVSLSVADRAGKVRTVTLPAEPGIPSRRLWEGIPDDWRILHRTLPEPLPLYLRNIYAPYWFEYLSESRTVYFQFNRVKNDPKEPLADFSSRLFKFIDEHDVDRLVIDLRWNNGGDTTLEPPLIHGLIRSAKINRPGKLFVIIGRRTFSAAQNGATLIEHNTDAVFVGEPTGSSPNFIGEEASFELPYSKLAANVSDLYHQSAWPFDHRTWIAPLIYVPPTFAAYRANRDPALEAVMAYR